MSLHRYLLAFTFVMSQAGCYAEPGAQSSSPSLYEPVSVAQHWRVADNASLHLGSLRQPFASGFAASIGALELSTGTIAVRCIARHDRSDRSPRLSC